MYRIRTYGLAFVLALLLHATAGLFQFALVGGLNPKQEKTVFQPKVVRATLIVMDEPQGTSSMVTPPPVSAVIPLPETDSTFPKPDEEDRPEVIDDAEELKKRLQTLKELRDSTLDEDISQTIQSLEDLSIDAESTSYINAIHTAIVRQWDRPPSARRDMEALLQVELYPTGELNTVNVLESSGNDAFDRSTEKAVQAVKKFTVPKDKELFENKFRVINLRFKGEDLLR